MSSLAANSWRFKGFLVFPMISIILSDAADNTSVLVGDLGGLGGLGDLGGFIFTGFGGAAGAKLISCCFFKLRIHSAQMPPQSLCASSHRYLPHMIHLPPCAVIFLALIISTGINPIKMFTIYTIW
jgi:hypothetical protein